MGKDHPKINVPVDAQIIRSPGEWAAISIAELDESMKHLMVSRKILIEHRLLGKEEEEFYRTAAEAMHEILKLYIERAKTKK